MKASIGLRTREPSFTSGGVGRTGFLRDHQLGPELLATPDDQFAPPLIQSRIALTSAADSAVLPGGICNSPSRRTALNRSDCSASPGTTAAPRLPPFRSVVRSRTSRPDVCVAP